MASDRLPDGDRAPAAPEPALVTAILVVHDGREWVEECLDGIRSQDVTPQRVVAVDTGSSDGSAEFLVERLGENAVLRLPANASLSDAVAAGVSAFAGAPAPAGLPAGAPEWLWLVHDDCAPESGALSALLTRAEGSPSIWAVGPKVRDWSGDRLTELGVTVDRVGHRLTGLERPELDQGQADGRSAALAAGTAGLLLRREAWDRLGGLSDLGWPGTDDVDLGWQIHAAGGRVALAPDAVVRHAAAMSAGRRHPADVANIGAARRRAGMKVVLANVPGRVAWLLWLRIVLGALPRSIGLLFLRRGRAAGDELAAGFGLVGSAVEVRRTRRARRANRVVSYHQLHRMLAGVDDRLRHLLDAVRSARTAPPPVTRTSTETGPVDEASQSLGADEGAALRRFVTRPGVALFLIASALTVIADRGLFAGMLAGGRLLPAPEGASDMWSAYLASWHAVGFGSSAAAPPGLAVLAALSTVAFGRPDVVVDVLVLGAVPLAATTAWLGSKVLTRSTWLRVWAALAWAVLPAVTGAVAGGRIEVCVVAILLPLLGRAAVAAVGRLGAPATPGAWARCAGCGLLLGLVAAFEPVVWLLFVAGGLVTVLVAGASRYAIRCLGVLVTAVVGYAVCEPWSVGLTIHPSRILTSFGLPDPASARPLPTSELVLLHPGGPGQAPLWVGAALLLAAFAATFRRSRVVSAGWVLLVTGLAAALVETRVHAVQTNFGPSRVWSGAALMWAAGGAIVAAVGGADGARERMGRRSFGFTQPAVALVTALAVAAAGWAAVDWLVRGAAGPLASNATPMAPLFVGDALDGPHSPRAVIVVGRHPLRVALTRHFDGLDLADGAVAGGRLPAKQLVADARLRNAVGDVIAGRPSAVPELSRLDVAYLVARPSAAPMVRRGAAAIGGFTATPSGRSVVLLAPQPTGELTVRPAVGGTTGARTIVLPATDDGSASVTLAAASSGRDLLLAEPADGHWHATLDGTPLSASTADGWEQQFAIPAGSGGHLVVGWSGSHRSWWLILELVLVVGIALVALPLWRLELPERD